MNRNRINGAVKQVKGATREMIGKVTGNRVKQAEGAVEKVAGKVQSKVGEAVDAVKGHLKK